MIWYDSFDDPDVKLRYFEFSDKAGRLAHTTAESLGGTGGSLRGLFSKGTVDAGAVHLAFGDNPVTEKRARPDEKFQQVFWRMYVKHQRGWVGNPAKMSRALQFAGSNWSEAAMAHVWGGANMQLTLDPASGTDTAGVLQSTAYNDFAHLRWMGNNPPAGFPVFATEESGKWVCIEAAVRLNTPGQTDGAFYLWIDARLDAVRDNVNWRGAWDEYGLNAVFLENYWNGGSPVEQSRYFDDFVVSTKPIGLARTPLNPEIVKTPFEGATETDVQNGLQVQVATSDGREIVWDSGIRGTNQNRVVVEAPSGTFRGPLEGKPALEPDTQYAVRVRQRERSGSWSDWSPWRLVIHTTKEPQPAQ